MSFITDQQREAIETAVRDLYEIAKDEINQSSAENVPIYVREMQAIQTYAKLHNIALTPDVTSDNP